MPRPLAVVLVILSVAAPAAAQALWLPVSTEEQIAQSDLVVVGKIVTIDRGALGEHCEDTATIEVTQLLKGWVSTPAVHLVFPGKWRGYLNGSRDFVSTRLATDILFDQDQEGIWFLKATSKAGHFKAPHPGRFKPRFFLSTVLDTLRSMR